MNCGDDHETAGTEGKSPVPEGSNDTEEDIEGEIEDQEGASKACRDTDVHDDDGGNPAAEATNEAGINSKGC